MSEHADSYQYCMPSLFANNDVDIICHLSCERKYWLCRFRDLSPTQKLMHFDIVTRSLVNYNHRSASKVRSLGWAKCSGVLIEIEFVTTPPRGGVRIKFASTGGNAPGTGKLLLLNTPTGSTF